VGGWRRVAGELSKMVAFLESTTGSMVVAKGSLEGKELQNSSGGILLGLALRRVG
jgi:hypothetical protein